MSRWDGHEGGAVTKLVGTILVLLLLVSGGLFLYTRTQDPLSVSDDAAVGFNDALADHETSDQGVPVVRLEPNGQIYLATTISNDGSLPITITGLGTPSDEEQTPYIPVDLFLGDGTSTDPAASAPFSSQKLEPHTGIGILVEYAANSALICSLFTETSEGSGTEISSFTLKYTTFGIPDTQTLDLGRAVVDVARPTRIECEQATGA